MKSCRRQGVVFVICHCCVSSWDGFESFSPKRFLFKSREVETDFRHSQVVKFLVLEIFANLVLFRVGDFYWKALNIVERYSVGVFLLLR